MTPFHISPILLLIIGFCIGTMSSFYGVGGGWLITPVLNILGLPMPYAIGSSLLLIMITSIFGTIRHRKLKNVSFSVGIIIGVTSLGGILIGKRLIMFLETAGAADVYVRILYMFFLSSIGGLMLFENMRKGQSLDMKMRVGFPPFLRVPRDETEDIPVSIPFLFFTGIGVGFLNSTMGVGGGFVLLPILIYLFKLPVTLSVGTSLFTILITGVQGATVYVLARRVNWMSVLFMTVTTIVGTFIGSSATKKVNPEKIKLLFALTLLSGVFAVLFKQIELTYFSKIIVFSIALLSTMVIIYLAYLSPCLYRERD
jgi:uncharacterized membrane protein YfcA